METKIEIGSCRGEVMKRSELESFIMETYNAEADYPWLKYPNYEVFRHCNNRKWFALIMDDWHTARGTWLLPGVSYEQG